MITVRFYVKKETVGFEMSGHSGYGEEGSDIICSAVSSCAYMTANTLTEILGLNPEIEVEDGVYYIDAKFLEPILRTVNLDDYSSLQYFQKVLRSSGIIDKLEEIVDNKIWPLPKYRELLFIS